MRLKRINSLLLVLLLAVGVGCASNVLRARREEAAAQGGPNETQRCEHPSLRPAYLPWDDQAEMPQPDRRSYDTEIERAQLSWLNPENPKDGIGLTVYPRDDVGAPEKPIGVKIRGAPGYLHERSVGENSIWWDLDEHCNFLELSIQLKGVSSEAQDREVTKVARSLEQ